MTPPVSPQVMGNLVMEKLLPRLEKELLPRLKAKRTERRRVWLAVSPTFSHVFKEDTREG